MATITPFRKYALQNAASVPEQEPEDIRLFRKIAESEDIRILLGNFFLKLAASESSRVDTPHADLLDRMLAGRDISCTEQLRILVKNLDMLRIYDIGTEMRKNRLKMLKETNHGLGPRFTDDFAVKCKDNPVQTGLRTKTENS